MLYSVFMLPVASKYFFMRLPYGKIEVVAPISAPMLQIVPIPVQLIDSTPGPKYSTIAPVPPNQITIVNIN
jgi:hypothetical protein